MTSPKLRFKGFDGDWNLEILADISQIITGNTPATSKREYYDGKFLFVSPGDMQGNRYVETTKTTLTAEGFSKCRHVPKNSILFVCIGSTIGKVAQNRITCATNQQINAVIPNKGYSSNFLYLLLEKLAPTIKLNAGVQAVPLINKTEFGKTLLNTPTFEEQTKIASFLSAVDEKISQLTQKHALLSQYKQGMMQKLFSQQIRFKADDGSEFGAWENKTLGEVGENIIGLTYSPTDVTNDSTGILVLRSSNIKEGRLDKSDQVRVNKKIKDKIIIQPNDILICTRNGSQRLIGKSVIINDDEIMTFGAFMSVYRSHYNRFIAYLMQTPWFFEQVQMNLGARINQITTGTLNEFTFDFPCLEEQTKIANFLSAIDQKIEVVVQQIEQAKQWKKGLLQQMFV